MAKLAPKDPQYGIPVSSRIDRDLAFRLNAEAEQEGISLSRYIAIYIGRVEDYEKDMVEQANQLDREKVKVAAKEKRVKELENHLLKRRETSKKVVNRFIFEISDGNKKQQVKYIETYNAIYKDEQQKYADGELRKTP
jgi:ParB-like chromosome segregation protein Spo0J